MKAKSYYRIGSVSANALRQIMVSGFGITIPFLVIHLSSKAVWGAFVSPMLFTFLALQVINWGNKEYLVRSFSLTPKDIRKEYAEILVTRFPLVLILSIIAMLLYPMALSALLFLWIFGRYLGHSAEALVIYEKKFNESILIESCAFAVFCMGSFFVRDYLDFMALLYIYSFYQLIRGVGYALMFREFLSFGEMRFRISYFMRAFPFFLLSILGFLASKIDVYIIERLGNKIITSDYQVINSLLVFTMSVSALIYTPFTKNLYRNASATLDRTKRLLALAGMAIVPVAVTIIWLILKLYLARYLPLLFYILCFLYVFPSFVYGIDIVQLFREKKEKTVVLYLFTGTISNAILSALFLYLGYGITGCLAGGAIAQIMVMLLIKLHSFEK